MPSSNNNNNNKNSKSKSRKSKTRQLTDEELAEQLQEQYRNEFLERQRGASSRPRHGNTSTRSSSHLPPPVMPSAPPMPSPFSVNSSMTPNNRHVEVELEDYNHNEMDDAAYARQVQMELEREARRLEQAQQGRSNRHSGRGRGRDAPGPVSVDDVMDSYLDEDARLAQTLQDEEVAKRVNHTTNNHVAPGMIPFGGITGQFDTGVRAGSRTSTETFSDDSDSLEAARRVAQEMEDAEMAARLSLYEQEAEARRTRGSSRRGQAVAADQQPQRSKAYIIICHRLIPLLCCGIVITIPLLFVFGVFNASNVPFLGDILPEDGEWIDPFKGKTVDDDTLIEGGGGPPTQTASEYAHWSVSGSTEIDQGPGLELVILNAMDDSWSQLLREAVFNWDDGYPIDSLSLTIRDVNYDFACEAQTGYLKACNGDYGQTSWRGLNEILVNRLTNTIVSSTARMNEFYLNLEGEDQSLYTLCHELGHGFGLPHWDENFFNQDLGNCMDYTNNPGDNKTPNDSNFLFLAELYGGRNVTTTTASGSSGRSRQLLSSVPQEQPYYYQRVVGQTRVLVREMNALVEIEHVDEIHDKLRYHLLA